MYINWPLSTSCEAITTENFRYWSHVESLYMVASCMSNTYCKAYVLQRFVPSWLVSHPFCVIHFCAPLLPFIAIKTNVNPIVIVCTTPSQVNQYLQTGQTQELYNFTKKQGSYPHWSIAPTILISLQHLHLGITPRVYLNVDGDYQA